MITLDNPICQVCNKNDSIGVAAMPGVPISHAYCRECLEAGAHPYSTVVANTSCIGSLDESTEWWRQLVADTLKHLGISEEKFRQDVQADLDAMDEYFEKEKGDVESND